jgi:hypothetical protein
MSGLGTTTHQDDVLLLLFDEGPELVVKLRDRAEFMDLEELKLAAARMRALASMAGASWLAEPCRDLDIRARFNQLTEIDGFVQRIAIEYSRVRSDIRPGNEARRPIITPALIRASLA